MKEKVVEEIFSNSESTKEEILISKFKKRSSEITISEPVAKKMKTKEKPPHVKRNIFIPRYIQWFSVLNLGFKLLKLFVFQDWEIFMKINEEYYSDSIEEFYESLKETEKNNTFRVKIKGQDYEISVDLLASTFGVKIRETILGQLRH